LAEKGANLFIYINDMLKINNMYRFSLSQYLGIFEKSLVIGHAVEDVGKKLELALSQLCSNVLEDFGVSLFKDDRLLFAMHIARAIKPQAMPQKEWDLFLGRQTASATAHPPAWVPAAVHAQYASLVALIPQLEKLLSTPPLFYTAFDSL